MGILSDLRRQAFMGRRTLSLHFSEPYGFTLALVHILVDCSAQHLNQAETRGEHRASRPHHPLLAVGFDMSFPLDLTAEETQRCIRECEHFGWHQHLCKAHQDVYGSVYRRLIAEMKDADCIRIQEPDGIACYYPVAKDEHLSVAVFDLDLLD